MQQVIRLARSGVALEHGLMPQHGALKVRMPRGRNRDLHKCMQLKAYAPGVDLRSIARDHLAPLELAHACPRRGLREADFLSQGVEGDARVILENPQDGGI